MGRPSERNGPFAGSYLFLAELLTSDEPRQVNVRFRETLNKACFQIADVGEWV